MVKIWKLGLRNFQAEDIILIELFPFWKAGNKGKELKLICVIMWAGGYIIFVFLVGVQLLYNIVLVSAVYWSESTLCIHRVPSDLPHTLRSAARPSWSSQSSKLSSLCYIAAFPSYLLYTVVYICQFQSPNSSPTSWLCHPHIGSTHPFSVSVSLSLSCK